jgi:putative transposase
MGTVTLTHKIRLDPTYKQDTYFRKACGVARYAWNWGLAKRSEKYAAGEKPNALALKKEFNELKKTEFPWVYEVTKYASQQPFIYLQRGFQAFFTKRAKHPKYKKKGIHDSFYIGGDQIQVVGKRVKIPNLGWVRLKESLRFEGKINGVTISRSADNWFVSINVETNQRPATCENQACVGVDLGIKSLATLTDGQSFPSNNPLKKHLSRLRRLQKRLSRAIKGSRNRIKIKKREAKLHYKITCIRNDALHKLTTKLTKRYLNIVIEDLDISEMVKNKKLSRSILDGGWHEFRRQLCYKAELRKNKIFIADKRFASSKRCSSCGNYKEKLSLSERTYKCTDCQVEIDRDLNAAICLKQLINTASFAGIDACGQDGTVIMLKTSLQPAWQKQELSHV